MSCFLRAALLSLLLACIRAEQDHSMCDKEHSFIPCGYDSSIRPNRDSGKPTEILLQMYIESFGEVDVEKMEIDAFGYLSQIWQDDRLTKVNDTPRILQGNKIKHLWTPDVYCINCRSHNLDNGLNTKQSMIRISENGTIYMSNGVSLTGSCYMNLRNFPFDVQHCNFTLSSYAYNTSQITYRWKEKPYVKSRKMDQFMVKPAEATLIKQEYISGTFVIAVASFSFVRRYGYYLIQLYIPTGMLVALSWTMFCLNHEYAGDRIAIGVTLFLTMIFLQGYANTSLPRVSYVKLVDLFMVVSLAEILFITIESIIVSRLYFQYTKKKEDAKDGLSKQVKEETGLKRRISVFSRHFMTISNDHEEPHYDVGDSVELENLTQMHKAPEEDSKGRCKSNGNGMNKKIQRKKSIVDVLKESAIYQCKYYDVIEKASMVLIPLSYIVFNVWYWSVLFN